MFCEGSISVTAVKKQSSQTEREPKSDTFYTYASTSLWSCIYLVTSVNVKIYLISLPFAFSLDP